MIRPLIASLGMIAIFLTPSLSEGAKLKFQRHRIIPHKKAYKKRRLKEPYINIKVTPPEKRGKDGFVGVEIYNYSKKKSVSVAHFWIYLETDNFMQIEAEMTVENMGPNWGDIRWIKVPLRKGKRTLPKITKIRVEKMEIFDGAGRRTKMIWTTDLIKE